MRVLNLSLDKKILENDSAVLRRLVALAEAIVEKAKHHPLASQTRHSPSTDGERKRKEIKGGLTVFVPGERDEKKEVSAHLTAHSFGGPKWLQLWKMWRKGKSLIRNPLSLTHPTSIRHPVVSPLPLGRPRDFPSKEGQRGKKFHLITVQDTGYLAFVACLLARRFKTPLEIQVHGFEKMRGVRERVARFVLRRADRIRVVSDRLKRELDSRFKLHDSRIYKLPVYTQTGEMGEKGENGERGERGAKRPFTLLTVGRLVRVKNIALQIRAFARIAREFPHVRLIIVGDGSERENLKRKAHDVKLEGKIRFEGRQSNLERYYREADAFLLTSDSEGWGVVVTEAAAYGLPIIMTDVGLANEVIHHDREGIVIPVGDEDALVAAMKRIIEDTDLRARLGKAARSAFGGLPTPAAQIEKQVEEWRGLQ